MKKLPIYIKPVVILTITIAWIVACQEPKKEAEELANDVTTPLHLLQAEYKTPYGKPEITDVVAVLDRVYRFVDEGTPAEVVHVQTQEKITDFTTLDANAAFATGTFRLTSYEWGVTYAGMLLATEATGDQKYAQYTYDRLKLIADLAPFYVPGSGSTDNYRQLIGSVMEPRALDDAGALCAAMIKAHRDGLDADIRPLINNFIHYISDQQFRLADGTLARNRPQPNTLWLDDLFMSVPALVQMGKLTGEKRYYDDAVKQIRQFSARMFDRQKGLYMHGWVQGMEVHPSFHWARANGWAVMTLVEVLDVLPEDHPGYQEVIEQLQAHVEGLARHQDGTGFWHQLLDRNDTYLETSATAIYTYAISRAINRGYIDGLAYAPMVLLGWNAVASKVNDMGQVEGTCVGTGMAFDPAFYYYRPRHIFAAHGYGPVLLAAAEVILLIKNHEFEINDSSLQLLSKSE